ncbi:FkbM family methyltransferase [Roseibium hamelinense]|uniref:FkbM family methyltransferase n=1 Tax=Roseibium hamelinense TaxID=150831 RepID=A0A562SN43_9HYPH|nr:FkbM family methyltransferase [Roseibium hamelinense]MTI44096.1 FkbM family methyltransferase [Roseibium hamelinense]TWI82695.1 FkbM family methyltransferase [Roseibium hamelinense]
MPSQALRGVFKSLRTYYGEPERVAAMDRLYKRFLGPGTLAFDIGSHVGDRIGAFRRCGARVVAVEPQPLPFRALQIIHGRDASVSLVQAACGAKPGLLTLSVNSRNPTVSTASQAFTKAAEGAHGWRGQVWDDQIEVPCVTLDQLIASNGIPDFVKIDVEGFEPDVLRGLSHAVSALSFEFTTIQRGLVKECCLLLEGLGPYRFNIALGESQRFEFENSVAAKELWQFVEALPQDANSGDVYAVLMEPLP